MTTLLGGCSSGSDESDGPVELTVYVSLPVGEPDGRDAADGARLALSDADGAAGDATVRAVFLDDSEDGRWSFRAGRRQRSPRDRGLERDRLRRRLRVRRLARFPAGHQPGRTCSRSRRRARPTTWWRRLPGSEEVPEVQASGERTFGRVIPSDAVQAQAGAAWVDQLGVRRVATVSDGSGFRRFAGGLVSAGAAARKAGVGRGARSTTAACPAASRGSASRLMVSDAELGAGDRASRPGRSPPRRRSTRRSFPPAGREFVAPLPRPSTAGAPGPLRRLRLRGDGGRPRLDRPRRRSDRPRLA